MTVRLLYKPTGIAAALLAFAAGSWGAAPSVRFGDLARAADCILVAEYEEQVHTKPEQAQGIYVFKALSVVSGTQCHSRFTQVFRLSDESPKQLARGAYLLFLKRRDENTYLYAREPFSILPIRNGMVSTLAFSELDERFAIESLLVRIHEERGANK